MSLSGITLLVKDQQLALDFFVNALGFVVRDDVHNPLDDSRWLVVASHSDDRAGLILQKASPDMYSVVGHQAGNGVFLILSTDDFDKKHAHMLSHGVMFEEQPRIEPYGKVAIFRDVCGNKWDLIQPS